MSAARQHGQILAAQLGADGWLQHWASIHESGHATVARYLGWSVELATLDFVKIPHPAYRRFDELASIVRLIISASGDAATSIFLGFTATGTIDNMRSRDRLQKLGAPKIRIKELITEARLHAENLVIQLRPEIEAVAAALRERGRLDQWLIDRAMMEAVRGMQ
jgi:hypothetical protein